MKTYLVGGAVRDELLNYPVIERDWVVVGATPEQMLSAGYRQVGRDFPVYLHPQSKEEYALARTERKSAGGHTGFTCNSDPTVTLEEDLSRRDLTINAMARDTDGNIIDPYGGLADLEHRVLRHVSPAFVEDPLRVLRVARFSARYHHLGFSLDADTLALMQQISASGELELLPAERTWKELEKALGERNPAQFFQVLSDARALPRLMPELQDNTAALQRLERASETCCSPEIRFAVLLERLPNRDTEALCERLRAPRKFRELAELCCHQGQTFSQAENLSAEELLQLLEQADALRRPERFHQFLEACELVYPQHKDNGQLLRRGLKACAEVSARQWATADISGKELGQRLREARRQQLEALTAPD